MSSRPKPRPRPRPRAPPATAALNTAVPPTSSPGPSSAATAAYPTTVLIPPLPSIEDEDALFMRNQTRTAQTWRKLNKLAEEKERRKRKAADSDSSSSERDSGSSPRARSRKVRKRPARKDGTLPDWTRKKLDEIIILSDSDDDIFAPKENKPSKGGQSPPKQRQRSRSRSLTPPPALPRDKIERARQAVNSMLGIVARAPSPTEFADDSVDTIVLDPELASVAQRVKAEAQRREGTPIPMGGGPENVKLRVVWKPHPLNPDGRSEELGIVQKRHENFHRVCAEIADLASVRDEHVVLSYDGMRVFPSSTPHSIGIWAEAELEACDRDTFNYLQESKQRMRSESIAPPHLEIPSRRSPSRARSPSNTEFSDSGSPAADSPQEDDKPAETFHLVVRSRRTAGKDIHLRVRPTTKCGAIVRAFLRKAGLEDEYPATAPVGKGRGRGKAAAVKAPALSVDGDRMESDTEIGVADLEDGDQVEVVGL